MQMAFYIAVTTFSAFWGSGCSSSGGIGLFNIFAFVGQLLSLFRVQQNALGRNADPNQSDLAVFKTVGAGGGGYASQAVDALVPANRNVLVVGIILVNGQLVAELAIQILPTWCRPYPARIHHLRHRMKTPFSQLEQLLLWRCLLRALFS